MIIFLFVFQDFGWRNLRQWFAASDEHLPGPTASIIFFSEFSLKFATDIYSCIHVTYSLAFYFRVFDPLKLLSANAEFRLKNITIMFSVFLKSD
jgi:hypothetical protein